jgi:hypothetical protein
MMLAETDGVTAPIEVPAFVDTYVGSRRHVPKNSGAAAGYTMHHWEIRGVVFLTVDSRTDVYKACGRCGGEGHYMYNSLDGTICYGCWGDGLGAQLTGWDAALKFVKDREARERAKQRKWMRELHEQAIAWDAWRDAVPGRLGLIAALLAQPKDEYSDEYAQGFLGDMARNVRGCKPLTEKQEAAAMRTLGQKAARIEAKQAAGHWGTVGKRAEVEVTIRSARDYDGDYGTRYLVVMETADGQTLKTWSSGEFGWEAARRLREADGQPVALRIKGTVKEHSDYQGAPQTELSRVALVTK